MNAFFYDGETPVSSEDVNKRAANFRRFVLVAEVPTHFFHPLPSGIAVVLTIYVQLPGMQKAPEFRLHVRDRWGAAVGPTADPNA